MSSSTATSQSSIAAQEGVEVAPHHVVLRGEVAEERAPADPGGLGDVVDGGLVEPVLGEEAERGSLERRAARRRRSTTPLVCTSPLLWHSVSLLSTAMADPTCRPTPPPTDVEPPTRPLVEDDLLVEDVSIDGMCGVY